MIKNKKGFYNSMELWVYISRLKDEEFDYNVENPNKNSQYAPDPIHWGFRLDDIYKDIVRRVIDHEENTKMTDWGTFVKKLSNTDLIEYLSKYKVYYEKINHHKLGEVSTLLEWAKELPDGEYLLAAQELC
jgi:hypothetical protein